MRIFEFQFNPNAKKERVFRVFSSREQTGEKGALYIVGEVRTTLPEQGDFLDRLAKVMQETYARSSFKTALKKANDFLAAEIKQGNTGWLGNLHIAALLFVPGEKGYTLSFTKVGTIKLQMARSGQVIDAGKTVEGALLQEQDAPKVFGTVGSGRVTTHDRVFVLTGELFEEFSRLNLIHDIAQLQEEKQFKGLFKSKEKELSKVSGVLFFAFADSPIMEQVEAEKKLSALRVPKFSLPQFPLPRLQLPMPRMPERVSLFRKAPPLKKAVSLFFVLALILGIGFALFQGSSRDVLEEPKELEPEDLPTPEVLAVVDAAGLNEQPQQFFLLDGTFYLFHPFSAQLVVLDSASGAQTVTSTPRNLRFGDTFANTFIFFAQPNIVLSFNEAGGWEETMVSLPEEFSAQGMRMFAGTMYVFDGAAGEIGKVEQGVWESWIQAASLKKPLDATSIAIDGNIWVLKKGGEIQRYFKGIYQESLQVDISPELQSPSKIESASQLPYLYVLDPAEKRMLVLAKSGELVWQYKSEALGKASDFAVSADGSEIYVLAEGVIYRVYFNSTVPPAASSFFLKSSASSFRAPSFTT